MATPLLIDTDMGIDDAVATCLAFSSKELDVQAIVGVGGNVPISQVMQNIDRVLSAIAVPKPPVIGKGSDPATKVSRDAFGSDGFGEIDWRPNPKSEYQNYLDAYRQMAAQESGFAVITMGPLTNLAKALDEPGIRNAIKAIYVSGGTAWAPGNATKASEFNFHADPQAAAKVLSSGLPITIVPLDVTTLVCLDESHVAHLAANGFATAQLSAKLLQYPLESSQLPGYGKAFIQDAVAVAAMIWPDLFLKTRMVLELVADGSDAGRCKPVIAKDRSKQVDLLTAVNAADLLENILESLCHEAFVV